MPYLFFNFSMAGTLFPNTFYAKQTEYAALQSIPFIQRFGSLALQPLIGAGIILLPVVFYWLYRASRSQNWATFASGLWVIAFIGLYATRLPVSYQHGRYEMPAIPVILLLGGMGGASWLARTIQPDKTRLYKTAWLLSTGCVLLLFFFLGAWSYSQDVAYIENEMVDTARWTAKNIPAGKLIAAHDIGALGYFGSHQIIDLAGLISPEIIPMMGNQAKIANYLDQKNVDYLVIFPSWYPNLIIGKKSVFSSESILANSYGGDIMKVYEWK